MCVLKINLIQLWRHRAMLHTCKKVSSTTVAQTWHDALVDHILFHLLSSAIWRKKHQYGGKMYGASPQNIF
jgi:hypothetical protein